MDMDTPDLLKLNVVIVSYNSLDTILSTIKPLKELYEIGFLKVVVVDNHCSDGVKELLAVNCPWVEYKPMPNNEGFGYGCNTGFKQIESEYTLFLNPDAVIDASSIKKLLKFLEASPNRALTAPATKAGSELQAAGMMPTPNIMSIFSNNNHPDKKLIIPHEPPFLTNWLCGAILLIRSSVFKEIEGFDEHFFLYFEETDLCKRVLDAGYEVWANGESVAVHTGGESSKDSGALFIDGCIAEHYYQSRYYFFKKHYGTFKAVYYELFDFIFLTFKTLKRAIKLKSDFSDELIARIKSFRF